MMNRERIARLISFDDGDTSTGYVGVSSHPCNGYPQTIDELFRQYEKFMRSKGHHFSVLKSPQTGEIYCRFFVEFVYVRFCNSLKMVEDDEYGVPVIIKLMQFGPRNSSLFYSFNTSETGLCIANVGAMDSYGDNKFSSLSLQETMKCREIKRLTQEFADKFETPEF